MNDSRVNKYRDLRAGLKDEAGINRENIEDVVNDINDNEEDDFLIKINRAFNDEKNNHDIQDTLTEVKTFEQMRQESNEELNRALRSAKVSVGKEEQYNTRMDILNKIREPEKQVIHIDNFDNVNTAEFAKGHFVNREEDTVEDTENVKAKKKMTLMERLASMSPEEDVKKAKIFMDDSKEEVVEETDENAIQEELNNEQTASLEEMLRQIKEKDQREVEKVLKQKEETSNIKMIKEEVVDKTKDIKNSRSEIMDEQRNDRLANILNYVIIFLVVVFIGLLGMIGYQLFF